jgi:hypothetical protein
VTAALALSACGGGSDDTGKKTSEDPIEESSLPTCESGGREACGTFITPTGKELPLGSYGAIMEVNVGEGYENTVSPFDSDGGLTCIGFSAIFGEDANQTSKLLDTMDLKFDLYTVYRPANWVDGEKYPIITWGNGTCAQPEGYGALLRYIASQGFFVIAANSRWVGGAAELLHALDFAFDANADPNSPYYKRLDTSKVAAMGHSQGSAGAANAAKDPRVNLAVLFNSGTSAEKPFLAISAETDINDRGPDPYKMGTDGAPRGAYLYYHMVPQTGNISGHLTLMLQPERVVEPTTAFLKYMLLDNQDSGEWFLGKNCKLCGHDAEYEFGEHGL